MKHQQFISNGARSSAGALLRCAAFILSLSCAPLCAADTAGPSAPAPAVSAEALTNMWTATPGNTAPAGSALILNDASPLLSDAQSLYLSIKAEETPDERLDLFDVEFEELGPNALRLTGKTTRSDALAKLASMLQQKGLRLENHVKVVPEDLPGKNNIVWAVAKAPSVRIFDGSGAGANIISTLPLGHPMSVLENDPSLGRVHVKTPDGRIAWAERDELFLASDVTLLAWNRREKAVVLNEGAVFIPAELDVFGKVEKAHPEAAIKLPVSAHVAVERLGWEDGNEKLASADKEERRVAVRLPGGQAGTIARSDLEKLYDFQVKEENFRRNRPKEFMKTLAEDARSLVGKPAALRGDSAEGYDDAGLIRFVFRRHDLILPREVDMLAYMGTPLSSGKQHKDLEFGDLLFFGTPANGAHTPIVREAGFSLGDRAFVEADTLKTGKVRETKLRPQLYQGAMGTLLWAIRLAPDDLTNPCMLSTRSHPYYQAPPSKAYVCRLRPH